MDYDSIFQQMYTLYRAESDTPDSTDDEYIIGIRLANEAVSRWENFDNTYWKELFTTLQDSTQSSPTLVTTLASSTKDYVAPTDMREVGGNVRVLDSNGDTLTEYPIVEPQDVQFQYNGSKYAWFTGDATNGYTMHLSNNPTTAEIGKEFDYDYYKKASTFSTGTDTTEMQNPYFIVHRMLANRFRSSRNPYYQSALRDAEEQLKVMQTENNSGTWANPWAIADRSGTAWGA